MYWAVPSEELASISPLFAQYRFHHADCVASSRLACGGVAAEQGLAVDGALPPVHEGERRRSGRSRRRAG